MPLCIKQNIRLAKIEGPSVRAMLGYINSFLSMHGIKINTIQKQEISYANKTNYYKLQLVTPDHDIDNAESIDMDDVVTEE